MIFYQIKGKKKRKTVVYSADIFSQVIIRNINYIKTLNTSKLCLKINLFNGFPQEIGNNFSNLRKTK